MFYLLFPIFLNYFKNVSSPEKITERIRESLESLVRDLNNNAERDINLVEGKISELKAVAAEADREETAIIVRHLHKFGKQCPTVGLWAGTLV